jgi:Domain of unknown function (DUF4403)
MKKALVLVALVVLVAGVLLAVRGCCDSTANRVGIPDVVPPVGNAPDEIRQAFPDRTSTVTLTVRIPFARLAELAEAKVPPAFRGAYDVGDIGGFSGIHVSPNLARDRLALRPVPGSNPPRVELASRLHGQVGVQAFKWIIVNLLVGTLKTKSPAVSVTLDVDADVGGWVSLQLNPDWALAHAQKVTVRVKHADTKVFGVIPVSLTGQFQSAADGVVPGIIDQALNAAVQEMPVKREVEKTWKGLFRVEQVSANPGAYVIITPQKVRLQQVMFPDTDYLTVRLSIDAVVQTVIANVPPPALKPSSLPALALEPQVDPKFRVLSPVGIDLSAVNQKLAAEVPGSKIELDGGGSVVVRDLTLSAKDGALFARVDLDADQRGCGSGMTGTVFLTGTPTIDISGPPVFRLSNVDLSVESASAVTKVAMWFKREALCRFVEEKARIDLAAPLEQARHDFNKRYGTVPAGTDLTFKPRVDKVAVEGFKVRDNFVVVSIAVTGEVDGEVTFPKK